MSDVPLEKATRVLPLTREQIMRPTRWEQTGKSPGNTPQAKIQVAQMLLQMLANPMLAPLINARALISVIVKDGPLQNATDIINSPSEMPNAAVPPTGPAQPQPPDSLLPQPGGGIAPQLFGGQAPSGPGALPEAGPPQGPHPYFRSPSEVPTPQ